MGKVFVSYRHADSDFAHRLAEHLQARLDASVFIDRYIDRADWQDVLNQQLSACNVFVLCVTPHTFDPSRIHQPGDWVVREIATALRLQKPLIPVMVQGHDLPRAADLPLEIRAIPDHQGVLLYRAYFEDAITRIAQRCVNDSNGGIRLRDVTTQPSQPPSSISAQGGANSTNIAAQNMGNINIGNPTKSEGDE